MSEAALRLSDQAREAAAEWCVRLSEGPLGPHDQQLFKDWLGVDPEHPALFERTVVAWAAIEDQASEPELLRMRGSALDTVHKAGRRRWGGPAFSWRGAVAIAASILVMIATGAWWTYMPSRYETGVGERQVVTLADGSSISLDAATRVDVRYLGGRRQLWLDHGRAKFVVAKDPLRPFSVQAGNRMIIATGTQFSVEQLSGEVRVVLYEGRVAVMDTARPAPRPVAVGPKRAVAEQVLTPGRELIIATGAVMSAAGGGRKGPGAEPAARLVSVDPGRSLGWEAGILEFTDEPLEIAVERMNRYGTRKLRVDDPSARIIMISGQFEGGDVNAFVEGVTSVFPVKAARGSDGAVELRAARR